MKPIIFMLKVADVSLVWFLHSGFFFFAMTAVIISHGSDHPLPRKENMFVSSMYVLKTFI